MLKQNILVKAYLKFNLGDDLFIKILLERYPNHHFFLFGDLEYNLVLKDYDNYTLLNISPYKLNFAHKYFEKFLRRFHLGLFKKYYRYKLNNLYHSLLKKTNVHLTIGGSLFVHTSKYIYVHTIEFYNLLYEEYPGIQQFFLGSNFGPYKDEEYKLEHESIFSKATDVCFRDKHSYNLFNHLKTVRCEPDIVFNLKNSLVLEKKTQTIGFSIVSLKKSLNEVYNELEEIEYVNKYIEVINYFIKENFKIKLFSFCKYEGDEEIINNIYDRLEDISNVQKVFYSNDIKKFLNEFQTVEYLFCGRFHSIILGLIFNIKILPICYSDKMFNLLEDINFNGKISTINSFKDLNTHLLRDELDKCSYDITEYKKEANKQFLILDKILKENIA